MNSPEIIIILEAVKIILRDRSVDDDVELMRLKFHVKTIEGIVKRWQEEVEMLKNWKEG